MQFVCENRIYEEDTQSNLSTWERESVDTQENNSCYPCRTCSHAQLKNYIDGLPGSVSSMLTCLLEYHNVQYFSAENQTSDGPTS